MAHKPSRRGPGLPKAKPVTMPEASEAPDKPQAGNPQTPSRRLLITSIKLVRWHLLPLTILILAPALLTQLGTALVGDVSDLLLQQTPGPSQVAGYLLQAVAGIWLLLGAPAALYLQLRAIGGYRPGIIESYRVGLHFALRLVGLGLLIVILVLCGLLLLVVPGLIILRRYALAPYFMMDEGLGIRQAMQRSAEATKPHRKYVWTTFGTILLIVAVAGLASTVLPALAGVFGVLSAAAYLFLPALRYQEISSDVRNGAEALR